MPGQRVRIEGLSEVVRAFRKLPDETDRDLARHSQDLAESLARTARAAGSASSRQAARAAGTVRVAGGFNSGVVAGPDPVLYGSEFGGDARYGWYADDRFAGSPGRQFRPHLGGGSYWFFESTDGAPEIEDTWESLEGAIIRGWGA